MSGGLYEFMPPGHDAITYVQAGVRFALAVLLIPTGGSYMRMRNVKRIHTCPHLVVFQLFYTFAAGGPYAWAISASIIKIAYVDVWEHWHLYLLCVLCLPN